MVEMMIQVHAWMAGETFENVDLKEEILPRGLISLGKESRCSLVFLL